MDCFLKWKLIWDILRSGFERLIICLWIKKYERNIKMMKTICIQALLIAFFLFVSNCTTREASQESSQPNVLLIIIDDLNDYEGSYGGHPQARTPNIDKLAVSASVFTNAHPNFPVCAPSRNSMFTGIYPHTSKDFGWTFHFKHAVLKDTKTFIELFKENGYRTLGSGKIMHKNVLDYWDEWGVPERINYGPHAFDGKHMVGHPSIPEPFRGINIVDGSFSRLSNIPSFNIDGQGLQNTGWTYDGNEVFKYVNDNDRDLMPDEMHADWAVKKINELEDLHRNTPFFLSVGFVNPHTPLYAPDKYFDMFPLDEIQLSEIKEGDNEDVYYSTVYPPSEMGLHYFQALKASYPNGDEGLRRVVQAYLACIAFVDDQVGKVMDALNNSKFRDNTIVILVSDHGWQFGEKDYLYKNSPWEESTRVPFIIRAPGITNAGSRVYHPVSLIDIYPTLIDMCHLKGSTKKKDIAPDIEGYSLLPFLEDRPQDWQGPDGALTVLGAGINTPIEGIGISNNKNALWHIEIITDLDDSCILDQNYSYRTRDWRYIRYRNSKEELYDHTKDPYEWNNLALEEKYYNKMIELRQKVLGMISKKEVE
jgi:arylsulfatase A-like enzyme